MFSSRVPNRGRNLPPYKNALQKRCSRNSRHRTQLSRPHSSMGFRGLIVEDLQNGRELDRITRFAPRNRKNRVNIGLSALRSDY
jgi:hypothetical protein